MATFRNARPGAGNRLAARARASGFTLIELAITCLVIAILAAMAVASYEYATVKARRGAAQACLTEAAQYMERYYTTEMKYEGASFPACSSNVTPHYKVRFQNDVAPTAGAYTIEAIPQGRQSQLEKDCGTMTIDQVGRRTPTSNCW
jgi:type IV pilus assembly protein PilE